MTSCTTNMKVFLTKDLCMAYCPLVPRGHNPFSLCQSDRELCQTLTPAVRNSQPFSLVSNLVNANDKKLQNGNQPHAQQEAISQKEIVFRFRKDIQSLRKAGILIFCA